ncbi:slr1659 superfamily regulator [Spirulina subsalsa]|uniref:slr1659 superfamily regulator n=1 Tax=Spirulina subsalsa TaxID=54311 RepID=UPI0003019AE4|nr:STAS domain-containing protein [Spirulina subsalsa]
MNSEVFGDDYRVLYDEKTSTIAFYGELSLSGSKDYEPIKQLLEDVVSQDLEQVILDLKELYFLNSSGISMLSKFVIGMRKSDTQLIVIGSDDIPWQKKSLSNLQKFLPSLQLVMEESGE